MLALEDPEDPNFSDTDYQLAAYAAALHVLTQYKNINDIDIAHELSKTRKRGETSPADVAGRETQPMLAAQLSNLLKLTDFGSFRRREGIPVL